MGAFDSDMRFRAEAVETTLDTGTEAGVDNITLNATMRRLARAHARASDLKQADTVLDQLVETFRDKDVPPPVLATIANKPKPPAPSSATRPDTTPPATAPPERYRR